VAGGGQDDEPLVEHRDRGGALEVVLQGDDGGVEAPLGELVEVVPGDHLTQVQVHLGQGLAQAVDENGGQVGRDGGDDAQAHRAAQRGALAGGGLAEGLGGQDGVPGVGQQGLAQGGDQDAAGGALHQLAADALLQCGDGLGQAGGAGGMPATAWPTAARRASAPPGANGPTTTTAASPRSSAATSGACSTPLQTGNDCLEDWIERVA